MTTILSRPTVIVNNVPVPIIPNTFKFDEGQGETNVSTQSLGGNKVDVVTSDNAEDKIGKCSFEMKATEDNVKNARGWKLNPGVNVIKVSEGGFQRVFQQMSIMNNYEVELSAEGKLSLEWEGAQPI